MTIAQRERREQIRRVEALLNGETVDGLKLNDPGLRYDRMIFTLAALREEERKSLLPREKYAVYFKPEDSDLSHWIESESWDEAQQAEAILGSVGYREIEIVRIG